MLKFPILCFLALTAALMTGCRTTPREEWSGAFIMLDKKSSGNLFIMHPGEIARIDLVENSTTGYRWNFRVRGGKAVKIARDTFIAPQTKMCGAPGTRQLYLLAKKPGAVLVEGELRRSWEKDAPPADKVSFKLQVIE